MRFENIVGCFIGLAVGDALGVPVEFSRRLSLKTRPVTGMRGYGTWHQPAGTWSDDSSLTFCLAESLIGGYDPNDIGKKFLDWYATGYWGAHHKLFDIGRATQEALERIKKKEDPRYSGNYDVDSNGNGSLMRIVPASLYFANEADDDFYDNLREISSITHAHFRSVLSCFIFSKLTAELLKGADRDSAYENVIRDVSMFADRHDFNKDELTLFEPLLNGKIASKKEESIRSSGYVLDTLTASIWCFLTTESFSSAVLKAVNLGDDTDTTGCVTGALAGLYYGENNIPTEWKNALARRDDIVTLANTFMEVSKKRFGHAP